MTRLWHRILCALGRHEYRVIAHITPWTDHIGCPHCGRQWGINYQAPGILPWSEVGGFYAEHYGYQREKYHSLRGRP